MISQLSLGERLRLYGRTMRRARRRTGIRLSGVVGRIRFDPVFVLGSPRSGTTVTAEAIGDVAGFIDLGEVNRYKRAVPDLYAARIDRRGEVVAEIRRILRTAQRLSGGVGLRPVEQTPESSFLVDELAAAFPDARFVHLVRDGRDVATSLLEAGWLGDRALGRDDAGLATGGHARFWVEAGQEGAFEAASEIRRCGWAWRRYEQAASVALARLDPTRVVTIRYEELAADPGTVATMLADRLGGERAAFVRSFARIHRSSVGRHRKVLGGQQLEELLTEVGELLELLDYR